MINFDEVIKPKDHRHKDFIHHNFIFAGEYNMHLKVYDLIYIGGKFKNKKWYKTTKVRIGFNGVENFTNEHLKNNKKSKMLQDIIKHHNQIIILREFIGIYYFINIYKENIDFHQSKNY